MSSTSWLGRIAACLVLCLSIGTLSEAATHSARTIGSSGWDRIVSLQETPDGGLLLAGYTCPPTTDRGDIWCVKLDRSGSITWQKAYGGSDDDYCIDGGATPDGGYLLAGRTSSFGSGASDVWVLKLDAAGHLLWQSAFGGSDLDIANGMDLTDDGGCIIVGRSRSAGTGDLDTWAWRLDSGGNRLWQATYPGNQNVELMSVTATPDGGCIAAGRGDPCGGGKVQPYCVRFDGSGTVLWQRAYDGFGTFALADIDLTVDGGCLLAGYATDTGGAGGCEAWCSKLDAAGNIVWQKTYGGTGEDRLTTVHASADGGCIVAGVTESFGAGLMDGWSMKLDASGEVVWQKTYGGGGNDGLGDVYPADDGGCVLAGGTQSFGMGAMDGWYLIVDATGDIDPSCGGLVSNSSVFVAVPSAATTLCPAIIALTAVVGVPTSAVEVDSTSTMNVLCSSAPEGPTITSITSRTSKPGSSATIRGIGFSTDKKKDVVYFGTKKVKSIKRAKVTSITITIPRVKKGFVDVHVVVDGVSSNTYQFLVK